MLPRRPAWRWWRRGRRARPRRRPRRRRHDAARASHLSRHRRAGLRRQLRAGRLPDELARRRARAEPRTSVRGGLPRRGALDARGRRGGRAPPGDQRRRRDERAARADGRARLGGRRRGPGAAALRRDDLRDALRLDRVQPLERRPGAHVGHRGDGDHLRRAALAARAAARRPARPDRPDHEPDERRRRSPSSPTAMRSASSRPRPLSRSGSARSGAGSPSCPR